MANATFTRMDSSSASDWAEIARQTAANQGRVAETILTMLRSLSAITDGFATDQLTHCLQTATLAEKAGADDEVVMAALCHDIGKAVSVANHAAIGAEMLKPYVRPDLYQILKVHQDLQGRHYYEFFGLDPNQRDAYRDEPWFALAEQFTDDWDQVAFDPEGETFPLEHFQDRVRSVFATARY